MKKIFNNSFLHKTLGISLCFTALSCFCVTNVCAQDDLGLDEDEVVGFKKTARPKKEKTYEMKEVTGVVTDDASGEPMGGVRVQALGLERYSTLTEEDGSYKLSIPVFSDAVYVYAEGYNPLQVAVKDGKADANITIASRSGNLGIINVHVGDKVNNYDADNGTMNRFNIYLGGGVGVQLGDIIFHMSYDHSLLDIDKSTKHVTSRGGFKLGVGLGF